MRLPSELPAMHGLHLPANALSALLAAAVRSLVGNSMHVAQVGCFVQYALATRSYRDLGVGTGEKNKLLC